MACVAGLALGFPGACFAEDIAPFRLTGIEGYASIGYLSDSETTGTSGGPASTYAISNMQEEIFINTHSYFYHPNFLKMELGGGPLGVQNTTELNGVGRKDNELLYNLTGRLNFLEQKSTPLEVYYEHLNPTVTTGLTQSFILTNTRHGATFSVREPLSPVLIVADAFRLHSEGRNATYVVNDDIEQASLRLSTALGVDGYGQLSYQVNHQFSQGGNLDLPILPTSIENHTASFDSRSQLGDKREFVLTNFLNYNTLTYERTDSTLALENFRFSPDLRWQHSETLSSFYNYNLYKSSEDTVNTMIETTNQSVRTGLVHRDADRLSVTADVHGDGNQTTGLSQSSYGAGLQASYMQPWKNTVLRLSAGASYDQKDRVAAAALIYVIGERIQLIDGIPVTLAQEYIDTGTIRVFNLARTQEYCPDVIPLPAGCTVADYRIIVIGSRTQIQRLATGNILDGQEVLVDYAFQTGGTAGFNVFDQNYQVSLTLYRNYTTYVRYHDVSYHLTSGLPTLPLNPLRNTLIGLRFDQPFLQEYTLGGEVMFERQDEEVSPFRRESYDAYLQLPSFFRVYSRFSGQRVFVDYLNSSEDVNLTRWAIQLRSNPWAYTSLTAEASYEEDIGGTLRRATTRDTIGLEWRIRQLLVRAEGGYSRELQGAFERDRTVIRISARRDF